MSSTIRKINTAGRNHHRFAGYLFCFALWLLMLLPACISNQFDPQPTSAGAPQPSAQPLPTPTLDTNGPTFIQIDASSKVFAKSDCIPTAITVTATITDPQGVGIVLLWHRVGADQPFTQTAAIRVGADNYLGSVRGLDIPGAVYGVWEFYLTAQDGVGNQSQSSVDTSVQLLPCVG